MNDLNRLLRDAAGSDGGERLDPQDLLAAGRRKVRNRHIAAAGAAAAGVAAIIAAVAFGTAPGDDKADVVDDLNRGTYEEVRITPAEVERRCSVVLNARYGTDVSWVAGTVNGIATSVTTTRQEIETREGHLVWLTPEGDEAVNAPQGEGPTTWTGRLDPSSDALYGECLIPQTVYLDDVGAPQTTPVSADDADAVADACSRRNGFDVSEWSVVASADESGDVFAILMSTNGYFSACELSVGGGSILDIEGRPHRSDGESPGRNGYYPEGSCGSVGDAAVRCVVYGVVPGLPDAYRAELVRGQDVVASTITSEGAFLLVHRPTPGQEPPRFRLVGSSGEVLANVHLAGASGL